MLRFGLWSPLAGVGYLPASVVGSLVFAALGYIVGLYSLFQTRRDLFQRMIAVGAGVGLGYLAILAYGSIDFDGRVGRGVMALSVPIVTIGLVLHHVALWRKSLDYRERLAVLVGRPFHEREAELFEKVQQTHTELVGVIEVGGYRSRAGHCLGSFEDVFRIVERDQVDTLLCPSELLGDGDLARTVRELRYRGVAVLSLTDLCEEFFQAIPLKLASAEWLLRASGQTRVFYVHKVKRVFDVGVSILCLLALALPFLLAVLAVKCTSPGKVFYRQQRCGRFGKPIEVIKLRTMREDAEADGPQWAARKGDHRLTPVGGFFRKFRIDEIPQLWLVLCGQMSFVGPRPERAEIIQQIADDIPLFSERLMVQPGLTGWAQVNFPYGASVDDAKRKLEYDLYYMKHMSVFLDFFILLDTIRIVFLGGAAKGPGKQLGEFSRLLAEPFQVPSRKRLRSGARDLGKPVSVS